MQGSLLSHQNRRNRLHVLGLDGVLIEDIRARLADDPRTRDSECIAPVGEAIDVEAVEALARGTVTSRVLILDVRSLTLPRLMRVYNAVAGYNRRDFNDGCHAVLIGDGPAALFGAHNSFDVMAAHLARFRIDYSAAAFFFDPFGHYPHEERLGLSLDARRGLPANIPKRLAKWFQREDLSVDEVRRYFRAASVAPALRQAKKSQRAEKLRRILSERLAEIAPGGEEGLAPLLSPTGLRVREEKLAMRVYPLFFEDCIARLLRPGK